MKKRFLTIALTSFGLFSIFSARAQWSNDPAINTPVCTANGTSAGQNILSDNNGGVFIAWQDSRNGQDDIYMQHFDSTGTALWQTDGIPVCTEMGQQQSPVLALDGLGGVIVAFDDYRNYASNDVNIYAQRVDGNGTLLWAPAGMPVCTAVGVQIYAEILPDNAGGAYITWARDGRTLMSNVFDVYIQRMNSSGNPMWLTDGINVSSVPGDQRGPKIIHDASDGIIVSWEFYDGSSSVDIYAQRFSSGGVAQWTPNGIAVCTEATEAQFNQVSVSDNNGGAIITWSDYRVSDDDIYAQRIDANGIVQWTVDGIPICDAVDYQGYPKIVNDNAGGAYIAWEDYRINSNTSDVYAQHIDGGGNMLWTPNGIAVTTNSASQEQMSASSDGSGGLLLAWRDDSSGDLDIYAQKINFAGNLEWTNNGIVIGNDDYTQNEVSIVSDNNGGAIAAFTESLGTNLFIQNICNLGSLGSPYNPIITISELVSGFSGSGTPSGGLASASDSYGGNPAIDAFDGDSITNGWASNNTLPAWLEYDFGSGNGTVLNGYELFHSSVMTGGWNDPDYLPSDWTFEGFNGSSWVVLDTRTNQTPSFDNWTSYTFTNSVSYDKYRINISNSPDGGYAIITEMKFQGAPIVNLCSNRTFVASANVPAGLVNYDWLLNGVSLGIDNDTLSLLSSNNGDVVNCVITANTCTLTTNVDTSNVETISTLGFPMITITGDTTICNGLNSTLTATGGLTYIWSNGLTSSSSNFTILTDSILTVTVTDTNGCLGYKSQMVYVNLLPNTNTTTTADSVITATLSGATYQWIDCNNNNSIILNETNQSFTASSNGNFAIIVNDGTCVDTSVCVIINTLDITDLLDDNEQISVVPNPNNGVFTIKSVKEGDFVLVNELGQIIQTIKTNPANNYSVSFNNLQVGIYFLVGVNNNARQRIIVTH